jgi:hypothetical protein
LLKAGSFSSWSRRHPALTAGTAALLKNISRPCHLKYVASVPIQPTQSAVVTVVSFVESVRNQEPTPTKAGGQERPPHTGFQPFQSSRFCVEYSGTAPSLRGFRRCVCRFCSLGIWRASGRELRYRSHLAEFSSLHNMRLPGT